jgi:hypothetical protein
LKERELDLGDLAKLDPLAGTNLKKRERTSGATYPDGTTTLYDAGESEDDIAGALLVGFWAFGNLGRVILYGDQRNEFEAFYARHMPSFFRP